ncbi:threonine synthase [Aerococcaceae bacterium DSM 111022]|nr:threonine synthase [Aerococcaceae bacterium DSM 111022]
MMYKSTRDENNVVTASQAILQGLAEDGGLYVPVELPKLEINWQEMKDYTYQEMAFKVLRELLDDFSDEQLQACIDGAYDEKFDSELIAPLKKADGNYYLELFHGSTIAFKDMALSILPYLMTTSGAINNNENDIVILTATSGDTGKAAMAGFADVPGTEIIVLYPNGGVSSIQERQMLTQTGDNTYVLAVEGNFDDAQTKVKELFNDREFKAELLESGKQFSSANSMNIGRLVPQIVYYFYAYAQLVKQEEIKAGDSVDFVVPTGNFGNILAAYYAKEIGLPVGKLICASNDNTVLYDFFETGEYNAKRDFILTISPSMDILISSNFERLLYHALGDDTAKLTELMTSLKETGSYSVDSTTHDKFADFLAHFATEKETMEEIKEVQEAANYVIDPHTAVAAKVGRKLADKRNNPLVIVSTASPYKFPEAVLNALEVETSEMTDEDMLSHLKIKSGVEYPEAIVELQEAASRGRQVIAVADMKDQVRSIVKK